MSAETLAEVLAEHRWQRTAIRNGPSMECACGEWVADHEQHQAAVIRDWLLSDEAVERAARAIHSAEDGEEIGTAWLTPARAAIEGAIGGRV